MIVNIRGTNGSGKSTIVRTLMEGRNPIPFVADGPGKRQVLGYSVRNPNPECHTPVAVVGRYETACGGCDTIKTQDEVQARVRGHAPSRHVLFEGVIVSDIYGRYKEMADNYPGEWLFAYLDTPLAVCFERIAGRRVAAGKPAEGFNRDLVTQKWENARRQFDKCTRDKVPAIWLDHTDPFPAVALQFTQDIDVWTVHEGPSRSTAGAP